MKVNRSKTEYLCINGGNDKQTVKMEDTKVPRVLGSTVQESSSCEREVKRVQAGWNGWRKVLGAICDRRLARVKGKVYSSVVRPEMMNGLEMVAVTKKQVEEMEVAEMKMLRFAMGVMRKDKVTNEFIKGTVTVRYEDEGGQAEVVWTCHERPRVCRKKDYKNGVTGKEEKRPKTS